MSTNATFHAYPCDRGTGAPIGYHHFQISPGTKHPVCVFCGKVAPNAISASAIEEDDE